MRAVPLRESQSTVPVAARPETGAATYAQVRRDAELVSLDGAFVDAATPPGCFAIRVRNQGGAQTYWLRGPFGDLKIGRASCRERVEVAEGAGALEMDKA